MREVAIYVAMQVFLFANIAILANDDKALKKDESKINGTWKAISGMIDGKNEPPPMEGVLLIVQDLQFEWKLGGVAMEKGLIRFDYSTNPISFDVLTSDAKVSKGIYQLKGEELKMCIAAKGDGRPIDFSCPQGSNQFLFILRRMPKDK